MSLLFITVVAFLFGIVAQAITREDATSRGVEYFSGLCKKQQDAYEPLLRSIMDRNLDGAIRHYIAARPFYEEIETLANSFVDLDTAIDARPYAFSLGEDSPSFRGFHKLERLLYRDQDIYGAEMPAIELKKSIDNLCDALKENDRFTPRKSWDGLLALAFEIPAKKISSEEETWSDLSLMIFRSNFRGIFSQYAPFTATEGVSRESSKAVNATYTKIAELIDAIDPEHGFQGTETGNAKPYSTVTVAQRKEILDMAYEFALGLKKVEGEVFKGEESTGEEEEDANDIAMIDSSMYEVETAMGVHYLSDMCSLVVKQVFSLQASVKSGNMDSARKAYKFARQPYEQIEAMERDFEEEAITIDARPYDFEGGETNKMFTGFHKVERALFRDNSMDTAMDAVEPLRKAVDIICKKLSKPENFNADSQWKSMISLAYEVPAKKISSESETWSDLSLMVFRSNLKGIYSLFEMYAPRLPRAVAKEVEMKYESIRKFLVEEVDVMNTWDGSDFRLYSTVPIYLRKGISDRFYAFARSLVAARDAMGKKKV